MQTNIQICTFMHDSILSDQVTKICAAQGWSVGARSGADGQMASFRTLPDIIIFDDIKLGPQVQQILEQQAQTHAVYLAATTTRQELPARCMQLDPTNLDRDLISAITTALNVSRFEAQFFEAQQAEPITKLPHHPELLEFMTRFSGEPTGLIVVQIDHAEHLYANLDPVSKTDLLGALSDHLNHCLPQRAYMGIFDAASFAIWCPDMLIEDVKRIADNLCQRGRTPLLFRGGELHFSLSAGHAYSETLTNPQLLWQQAWAAKEQVKAKGGNGVSGAKHESDIGDRIPDALSRDEFSLVLQPQWDIKGEAIKGVETLLRWQGMEVGNIAPDHFIPIAEKSGQMARVGDWVLERACSESATWLEHLVAPILLGINVSPQQFVNDAIKNQVQRLAKEQWLDPGILELEFSHDNLLHVVDQHRSTLFELRDHGVRVAIDNLGVGIVDTNKLLRCPADTLKIDRSLVANIEDDPSARTLVEQICNVGQRFNLRTVGVGVETESQRQILEDLGCTDAQGYLLSEPVPLESFQKFLAKARHENQKKENIAG